MTTDPSENQSHHPSGFGRFSIDDGCVLMDGIRIRSTRSAHAIAITVMNARGSVVSYDALAAAAGSRSSTPANLVKVHMHHLRAATDGRVPIRAHRGAGLSWEGPLPEPVPSGFPGECDHVVAFLDGDIIVDGDRIDAAPLSARIARYLSLSPGVARSAEDIARAVGSATSNPSNLVKVALSHLRRAFASRGLTSPVRNVRGRGTLWVPVASFAEHDVAETDADRAGDHQPPHGRREARGGDGTRHEGGTEPLDRE